MTAALEQHDWSAGLAQRTRTLGGGEITAILALAGATDIITFSGGFPDPATFPAEILAEIAGRLIAGDAAVSLQYAATEGLTGVRDYMAGRLESLEGARPGAGELMITSGGIDCMELLAKSYLDPGDQVVVEAPTYLGAIMAFRGYEADLHGVPMDDDGMRVDVLAGLLAVGGILLGGDLAELLVHRAEQEDQGHAHRGHDQEAQDAGLHVVDAGGRGGGRERGEGHRLTVSRMPANRSSSGSSVSTTDLAR